MNCSPFPFLLNLPVNSNKQPFISEIELFSDKLSRLFLTRARFSVDSYCLDDFRKLGVNLPHSMENTAIKRQAEYLCGRYLSRLAMQKSGIFLSSIPQVGTSHLRAPNWPDSVTGSITHHRNRASVVVLARPLDRNNFVGVDSELWLTLEQASEVRNFVHNNQELTILLKAGLTAAQATTLLFSAKEALFKAVCPFVNEYFGFETARLQACSDLVKVVFGFFGSMQIQLVDDGIARRAPQRSYKCWFSCNECEVLTLVFSNKLES